MKSSKGKRIKEKKLDDAFSIWIRHRDKRCLRCGTDKALTNSHFYTRTARSVRFDPENCDTLCWSCHRTWERRKNGEYLDWKKEQLGEKKFNGLRERYYALRKKPLTEKEKAKLLKYWHDLN